MKYAKFSDDFLSDFRLDDNGETLVLTDKRGYTRAVKLLPYEERTQGDLISREALKKCAIPCEIHNGALTDLCVPLYQIDNVPTVEYPFYQEAYQTGYEEGKNERAHKAYNEGFKDGVEQGIKLSQGVKGEWIDCSEDYGYVECPFCHELTTCSDNIDELHFCWHCGAKLGKGGAE